MKGTSTAGRKLGIALAVLLISALAVAGLYKFREASKARALRQDRVDGMAAYERQAYAEAVPHLSRYVAKHREDAEALLAFADSRRMVPADDGSGSHIKHAMAVTRLALERDPGSLRGRVMLMELSAASGLATETDRAALAVLELDPLYRDALLARREVALATGQRDSLLAIDREMAERLPNDFQVQYLATIDLIGAGAPAPELEAFVAKRLAPLQGTVGGELLAAVYTNHLAAAAESDGEGRVLQERSIGHLLKASTLDPVSVDEAVRLILVLDASRSMLPSVSSDELLRGYLADGRLGGALIDFAARRAWQRNDAPMLETLADGPDSPEGLADATLGWLALGLPDRADLATELRGRDSGPARVWSEIVGAAELIEAGRFAEARTELRAIHTVRDSPEHRVCQFLDASCLSALGERSLAAEIAGPLTKHTDWVRARMLLRDQAIAVGDYKAAYDYLQNDELPETGLLLLVTATALEESGHRWEPGEPSALDRVESLLTLEPDQPALLALRARALLAAGRTDEALATTDRLLALQNAQPDEVVVTLADRLVAVDGARAEALLDRFGPEVARAGLRLAAAMASGALRVEDARPAIEAALAKAGPVEQRDLRMLLATVLDTTGSPDAADFYRTLAADFPTDAAIQTAALESSSLWQDLAAAREVIGRLRSLTGDDGLLWRVYDARLVLTEDLSEKAASKVHLDLAPVLVSAPNDVLALQLNTTALIRLGDLRRAAGYATRAADAAPGDFVAAARAVEVLERAGLSDEARARVEALASIPLLNPEFQALRADLLRRFGFTPLAVADWKALAAAPDPVLRSRAAMALAEAGAADEAAAAVESLRSMPDALPEAIENAATTLVRLGRMADAVELLRASPAFDLAGADRDAAIARLLAKDADDEAGRARLLAFVRGSRSGLAWAIAARRHLGAGLGDQAREILTEGLDAVDDPAPLQAFQSALTSTDEQTTTSYLEMALAARPTLSGGMEPDLLALIEPAIRGDISLDEFAAQMRQFVERRRDVPTAWDLLVRTLVKLDKRSEARQTIRDMLRALPNSTDAAMSGVRVYQTLFEAAPPPEVRELLGEALPIARHAAALQKPPTLETSLILAKFAAAAGRAPEAWTALSPHRAEITAPSDIELYTKVALNAGELDAARDMWWGQSPTRPEHKHAAFEFAGLIADPTTRERWLSEASSKLDPGDERGGLSSALAWYNHASLTNNRQSWERALAATEADATDTRISAVLARCRAACLEQLGRQNEAIDAYRAALQLDSDHPDACNNLAYLLLQRGDSPAEAAELAEHAVESARAAGIAGEPLAAYLDTLGSALAATGKPEDALRAYTDALQSLPDYPHALVGRAECLARLGRPVEAREALNQVSSALPADLAERVGKLRAELD
ncbi:MAG: tetratricopeptide repeat protein [Phycisphaerales bacterium]|nr:tetratricopeptide repeat protein [Phycisphaerales bacterium]